MRVFITGASAGLGRALALRYASRGAILGLVARRTAPLQELAVDIDAPIGIYEADVRDTVALQQAAMHFLSTYGVPDVVIANAGVSAGTDSALEEDIGVFDEVLAVNVSGMVRTFQPFLAAMKHARTGRLAGIASVAGYRGLPGAAAYSASKAAAIAYLESLRVELRGSGITVTTICPGYVATAMTAHNPYPMPFLMSASAAAAKIVSAIDSGRSFAVIPWQMALVAKLLRVLPNPFYDRILAQAPRKPRRS